MRTNKLLAICTVSVMLSAAVGSGAMNLQESNANGAEPGPTAGVPTIDRAWLEDAMFQPREAFRILQAGDHVPGEIYVQFDPAMQDAAQDAAHAAAGAVKVLWRSQALPGLVRVKLDREEVLFAVNAYLDDTSVIYAEPDYVATLLREPNDPGFALLWGLWNFGATYAWDQHLGDPGFKIGLIDSGIDYNHPDLVNNVWTNPGEIPGNGIDDDGNGFIDDVHGYDFANLDGDPMDRGSGGCGWHGTHVAGTMGAEGNNGIGVVGVNWWCMIVTAKVLPDDSTNCQLKSQCLALEYIYFTVGCTVSNNSYESPVDDQSMYNQILRSQDYGHVFVASAGNAGQDNDRTPIYPASYDLDNIISVAAIDMELDLAGFSNYGLTSVDLAGPGVGIYSTVGNGRYGSLQGTSMASPHVAGALALVRSAYPSLTWQEAKARILNSVIPLASLQGKVLTGGVVNYPPALSVWVDFNYEGEPNGLFAEPWRTMDQAFISRLAHLLLTFKSGSTNWTGVWDKPMTFDSYNGSTIIGAQ